MPAEATIRDFYTATGETFDDLLDDVLVEDVVLHDPHSEDVRGRDRASAATRRGFGSVRA